MHLPYVITQLASAIARLFSRSGYQAGYASGLQAAYAAAAAVCEYSPELTPVEFARVFRGCEEDARCQH